MTTISLREAQARLAETVKRTETGPVVLEVSGHPVAVVLSVEEYHRLSVAEVRQSDRLSQEAYDQILGPFDRGEFRELIEPEWQALMDGKREFRHDPRSLALPSKDQGG